MNVLPHMLDATDHRAPASAWRSVRVATALLALAAGSCRQSGPGGPEAKPAEPSRSQASSVASEAGDMWDAVLMGGVHVGSVHTTVTRGDDSGTPTVTMVSTTQLAIGREGDVATMEVITESVETPDGQVRRFKFEQRAGGAPIVVEGSVRGDVALVTHHTMGMQTNTQLPWKADQGGFFAVEQSLRRVPLQPGERRTVSFLMPDLTGLQLASVEMEAQQREDVQLLDGTRNLLRIKQTVHLSGLDSDGYCWTDERGEMLKSILPLQQMEVYRTTRERASATAGDYDITADTLVRVTTPLETPHGARQIVYEATLEQSDPRDAFVAGASQVVEPIDDRRARITVRAVRPGQPPDATSPDPPTDADRQPNNLIQSDDAEVRKLASAVAPDATDPWEIAVALERWVCQGMRSRNFEQAFVTAGEVARTLEGDCTEHAVLLAALCRARGIPARVSVGLVYVPRFQAFGFHMWDEVWIADRWVPLDATLGRGGIGAGHITLQHSNFAADQTGSALLSVLQVMKQLKLQVLDVQ